MEHKVDSFDVQTDLIPHLLENNFKGLTAYELKKINQFINRIEEIKKTTDFNKIVFNFNDCQTPSYRFCNITSTYCYCVTLNVKYFKN